MRGYEPSEVDKAVGDLQEALEAAKREAAGNTDELSRLQASVVQLKQEVVQHRARAAAAEAEHAHSTAAPTYADLGDRIGSILTLAEEEAKSLRDKAVRDAEKLTSETAAEADRVRADADNYARDVTSRADAEVAKIVANAQRQADEIVDAADREATARRQEAEAVFENQRAKSAAASADFEKTLADRRDKAAAEFAAQAQANEEATARAEDYRTSVLRDADRIKAEAESQAEALLKSANAEAARIAEQAREAAEKIRRESDRELQAATSRRDAITAQLTNVRQMLATLGGAGIVNSLVDASPVVADLGLNDELTEAVDLSDSFQGE
jgi:cell division septum initiation protein DivIVA